MAPQSSVLLEENLVVSEVVVRRKVRDGVEADAVDPDGLSLSLGGDSAQAAAVLSPSRWQHRASTAVGETRAKHLICKPCRRHCSIRLWEMRVTDRERWELKNARVPPGVHSSRVMVWRKSNLQLAIVFYILLVAVSFTALWLDYRNRVARRHVEARAICDGLKPPQRKSCLNVTLDSSLPPEEVSWDPPVPHDEVEDLKIGEGGEEGSNLKLMWRIFQFHINGEVYTMDAAHAFCKMGLQGANVAALIAASRAMYHWTDMKRSVFFMRWAFGLGYFPQFFVAMFFPASMLVDAKSLLQRLCRAIFDGPFGLQETLGDLGGALDSKLVCLAASVDPESWPVHLNQSLALSGALEETAANGSTTICARGKDVANVAAKMAQARAGNVSTQALLKSCSKNCNGCFDNIEFCGPYAAAHL